jgi:hypothetical protein
MSIFNPIWRVTIGGIEYTNYALANLSITSGRTNIYEQANAGYVNLQLINLDQSIIDIEINDGVTIELQDSTATFVPIFGGTVVEFDIGIVASGVVGINQSVSITALGALSRLPKALTDGVLTKDFDGDQILSILTDLLVNSWNEVPASLQWNTYDPTTQWQDAENNGLGEIDTPGSYELANRGASTIDVYSLVSALATSGLGYIYENALGQISYASADHRSIYLANNGYTDVSAAQALANSLSIQTRTGDIRNEIVLKYGGNSTMKWWILMQFRLAYTANWHKSSAQQLSMKLMLRIKPLFI